MKLDQEIVVTCCANAHAGAVAELLQAALPEEASSGAPRFTKERIIRDMGNRLMYIAVLRHQVVGAILLSDKDSEAGRIEALAVTPDYQGFGIGELLVETAEKRAGELGMKALKVLSAPNHVSFFTKYGYVPSAGEAALEKALA